MKSREHGTGEKRKKGQIYIQSLTGLWALVQCSGIDKESLMCIKMVKTVSG